MHSSNSLIITIWRFITLFYLFYNGCFQFLSYGSVFLLIIILFIFRHALGAFNLGIVSGPAEGLLITSIIAIVGSYMPCGWFSTFIEGSTTFKRYDYVFYVYVVVCSLTCL